MPASPLRRHATSLVLVAAAAALGGYMLWVERDHATTDERAAREGSLLPILRRDDISEIAILTNGESFQILRRDPSDGGDMMYFVAFGEPPREVLADQIAVEQLLQALEFASRVRSAHDADPAVTGLQDPKAKLTVRMGRVTYQLTIGNAAKLPSDALYVRLEGEGTFVARGSFTQDALRPLGAYRSRTMLPYVSSQLKAIHITGDGRERHFVRGPWGGFRIGDDGPRVSQIVFDRLLTSFASIAAERFVDADQAAAALQQASTRVDLTLDPTADNEPRAVLALGGACPGDSPQPAGVPSKLIVALRKEPSPIAACVPSHVLDDLRMPPEAYRDRSLFQLRADEVEQLELRRGDGELEMARKGEGWRVREPVEQDLRAQDAESFLTSLLALEGEIVSDVDLRSAGLEPPAGSLRVLMPAGPDEEQAERAVQLGALPTDRTGSTVVRRDQDGILLRLTADQARLLVASTTLIRSTRLIDVPEQRVKQVEVVHDGGEKQVVVRASHGFDLLAPAGFSADASLSVNLFQTLASLSAERWVADSDDGSFGFAEPSLVLTMQVEGDAGVPEKLLLGDAAVDGRYGRFEPGSGVFVVSRTVENTLRGWVIDRSLFMVDPNEVRALRLVSSTRDVRVNAHGETWSSAASSKPQLPDSALATIRQALIDLRAEGVVHLGAPRPGEGVDTPVLRIVVQRVAGQGARSSEVVLRIGRGDVWRNTSIYYARRDGMDATFAIAAAKVRPLLDLLAPP